MPGSFCRDGALTDPNSHGNVIRGNLPALWAVTVVLLSFLLLFPPAASARGLPARPLSPLSSSYTEINYTQGTADSGLGSLYGVAFNPQNSSFYTVDDSNTVTVIRESPLTTMTTFTVPSGKYSTIAIDPVHQLGFVNGGATQEVTIFNATSLKVVKTLVTGGGAGLALDTQHGVVMFDNGSYLSFYSYASWTGLGNVPVSPSGKLAFDPVHQLVAYVASGTGVGLVNESTLQLVKTFTVPSSPLGLAYDEISHNFLVGTYTTLTLIQVAPTFPETNYTLSSGANANAIVIVGGGADEALLWEYAGTSGARLLPFDLSRDVFLPSLFYATTAWPANIAIDPASLTALAVDPLTYSAIPYLPHLPSHSFVNIRESGLAPGTNWCATLNGSVTCSTSTLLSFSEPAGTYAWSVSPIMGYSVTPASGSVAVASAPVNFSVVFTALSNSLFNVTFTEAGLPSGTNWSVVLNLVVKSSLTSTIVFPVLNGSYSYFVGGVTGYVSNPSRGTVNVTGSATGVAVNFSAPPVPKYAVTFAETGLPAGTSWSVSVNGTNHTSTTSTIVVNETNGTYTFVVGSVTGYNANPSTGTVTVKGGVAQVPIMFTAKGITTYQLNFTESGLPTGTSWSVSLNGTTQNSTASSIVFVEPKGNYTFVIPTVPTYHSSPSTGSVTLTSNQSVAITFLPGLAYNLTFVEQGLVAGTNWSVTISPSTVYSTTSTLTFHLSNGTYTYVVSSETGYSVAPAAGSITISGGNLVQTIIYTPIVSLYKVTFSEVGLPTGVTWTVTLGSSQASALTPNSIVFGVANGSYTFVVAPVSGYSALPSSGTDYVNGAPASTSVTFSPVLTYTLTFSESGLPAGTYWWVQINNPANRTFSSATTIVFNLTNGGYTFQVGNASGYTPSPSSSTVTIAGSAQTIYVVFTPPVRYYTVHFVETGLPGGTLWSVSFHGTTNSQPSPGEPTFSVPNGTWSFTVGSVQGYTANVTSGVVNVQGSAHNVYIGFTSSSGGGSSSAPSFMPGSTLYDLVWIVAIVAVGIAAGIFSRPKHSNTP